MPSEALPIPHDVQRRMREEARLTTTPGRDITVTWGPVTTRHLLATVNPGT